MLRLIKNGWARSGTLALKVVLLARNRVISSVRPNKMWYLNPGKQFDLPLSHRYCYSTMQKSFNFSEHSNNGNVVLKPPLKWAGGKRWLVPYIHPIWEKHSKNRLVEPFVGGLAISLGLLPKFALLNDANIHLINFYKWLQRGLYISIDMENEKELYYRQRKRFNELIRANKSNTSEAASLFYYLNRTGFNGLCRFNSKGEFNVPMGRYKTINYTYDFTKYSEQLSNWDFSVGDFEELEILQSDFVYADPPYDVEFTTYSPGGFDWADQIRLANWLAKHRGPVIVSNQATKRIIELYENEGFEISILDGPRKISRTGDRTPAREILAKKNI